MKGIKRLVLALALFLGILGVVNSQSVSAETQTVDDKKWVVYESSLLNCYNNNFGGEKRDSFTLHKDSAAKPDVKGSVGSGDTYYTADGQIGIKVNVNAQTCRLSFLAYGGSVDTLDLTIPDSIEFVYCNSQKSIKDTEDTAYTCTHSADFYVTSLGTAFNGSNYVTNNTNTFLNLVIPTRVTTLDNSTFEKNTKLKSVKFNGAIQDMGTSVFSECNNLMYLDLTNLYTAMNTIPDKSFYKCTQLENIVIPDTILNIGNSAFYQCDKIDYLILSDKIKAIGREAFAMCSNMRYIYVPSNYQDWSTIVDATEVAKVITTKNIAVNKDKNSLVSDSGVFGGEYYIHAGVDMVSAEVTVDGVKVPVTEYMNSTVKVKGFAFDASKMGSYKITGEDIVGNKLSVTLKYTKTINDKKAPVIKYNKKSVSGTKYFNKKTSVSITDAGAGLKSVKLNGKIYKCNNKKSWSKKITKDGTYRVTAIDAQGNQKVAVIVIDTKKPTIYGARNGKKYKGSVYISYKESGSGIKKITVDGQAQDVNSTSVSVSGVGSHTVSVTDKAGNKTVVKFRITE